MFKSAINEFDSSMNESLDGNDSGRKMLLILSGEPNDINNICDEWSVNETYNIHLIIVLIAIPNEFNTYQCLTINGGLKD